MTKALTYIELEIPFCDLRYGETTGAGTCPAVLGVDSVTKCFNSIATCPVRDSFTEADVTLRFAKDAAYLPREIDCIPSILDVAFTPATISLGVNLGTRATLSVTFKDGPHTDTGEGYDKYLSDRTYDPYSQGTYWGKFRARQPFLRGRAMRWISGIVGQELADMETRHFIIDSIEGPTADGKFTIIAKDMLKLADGDRAQAPIPSNGYLAADITAVATSATLLPTGIGNAEYPAFGYICIGGNEVVAFTRTGDSLALSRAQVGSTASTHKAQDRCQLVLEYGATDAAAIIRDLFIKYTDIDPSSIPFAAWLEETAAYLGTLYTGYVCEPTSVNTLASEFIEQAALAIWNDNITQQIRLQVLRGVLTDADTFTPDNTIAGTLTIKDQPEKRYSRVQVYFGQKDPTKPLSNLDNFRSMAVVVDEDAETDYGSAAIKNIYSRWIPEGGRSVAERVGAVQLGRYRDPPRRLTFSTARHAETDVDLGGGYRIESQFIQDETGAPSSIPVQVTRLNPRPDRFEVEAEEMLFSAPAVDLANRKIFYETSTSNVNLRSTHDTLFPTPESGDVVNCYVNSGVVIGSNSIATPAFDVGSWPVGVIVNLIVNGRIQGGGGDGGAGGGSGVGSNGQAGGPALYTRFPINLTSGSGLIWAGGGGGGGGGGTSSNVAVVAVVAVAAQARKPASAPPVLLQPIPTALAAPRAGLTRSVLAVPADRLAHSSQGLVALAAALASLAAAAVPAVPAPADPSVCPARQSMALATSVSSQPATFAAVKSDDRGRLAHDFAAAVLIAAARSLCRRIIFRIALSCAATIDRLKLCAPP